MKIAELKDGNRETLRVLVQDCHKCVSSNAKPYLNVILCDSSGTLDARKWEVNDGDMDILDKGNYVEVEVAAVAYDKKLQGKILRVAKLSLDDADFDELLAIAPVESAKLHEKCKDYIASIQDPVIGDLVKAVFRKFYKKYREWPAAATNHHNYRHGLLYHSVTMTDLASKLCDIYPVLNRDIMIGGTLLHDIGKTIELSGPLATHYTLEGKLVGHLVLGQDIVREAATELGYFAYDSLGEEDADKRSEAFHKKEVAIIFEHILISHHGQPDYGSPIRPLTRESLMISMIDDIDAKMMILNNQYKDVEPGDFTGRIVSMDGRYFYKPMYTKDEEIPFGLKDEEE